MDIREYKGNLNVVWYWIKHQPTKHSLYRDKRLEKARSFGSQNYEPFLIFYRDKRLEKARSFGYQTILCAFVVDRGHSQGPEIHFISDRGVIYIFNLYTHKFVTLLIARPNQVLRYFEWTHKKPNKKILNVVNLCYEHEMAHLNMI